MRITTSANNITLIEGPPPSLPPSMDELEFCGWLPIHLPDVSRFDSICNLAHGWMKSTSGKFNYSDGLSVLVVVPAPQPLNGFKMLSTVTWLPACHIYIYISHLDVGDETPESHRDLDGWNHWLIIRPSKWLYLPSPSWTNREGVFMHNQWPAVCHELALIINGVYRTKKDCIQFLLVWYYGDVDE